MSIFRMKTLLQVKEASSASNLKKTLTAFDLIVLGIGAVIGTGIFVITGPASQLSGPALPISFLLSGFVCMFVALVYTEIATMIPTSGSVYTYAYLALGEVFAWIVGMLILIEFAIGGSTVAAGWSAYMVQILHNVGISLPHELSHVPAQGGICNLPAIFIAMLITYITIRGTKESALLNNILVIVKLAAIMLFVLVAFPHIKTSNWENFAPHGFSGIASGSALVFLAFGGFDSLATAAEECKNPKRDLTIGLIGSLLICTLVYMIVSAVLTLIVPYTELNNAKPLSHALTLNGSHIGSALLAVGGVAGMTTVMLVNVYAQSRIFYAMSRDGLLPKIFMKMHRRFESPYISVIVTGVIVAFSSGFIPINILGALNSAGLLSVFAIACVIVLVLRVKMPDADRPFRCPLVFIVSPLAIISCCYLMYKLLDQIGLILAVFLLASLVIYFLYSMKMSNLNKK
jgi:basic amino acid/polyamine antiporter, APA family